MTALDRQLARTFRAARWAESGGQPVCRFCFDGADLRAPEPDRLTLGLQRYHCAVCRLDFSDTAQTCYATLKPVPLALWAYLTLHGDPRRLGWSERQVQRCFDLAAKTKGQVLPALWRVALQDANVTAESLRRRLCAAPRVRT